MNSPMFQQENVLSTVTDHLWAGRRDWALRVVQNLISVNPASTHQASVNGAGWEIEIDGALSGAYALPNLGANDRVFTNDTERRWLIRLRKEAVKLGINVVRKWQNRLMIARAHSREDAVKLAEILSEWIVDAFTQRHVIDVEKVAITLVQGECPYRQEWDAWYVYLDDGREILPNRARDNGDGYQSFLDALFVAVEVKRGTQGARYLKRSLLWRVP